MAETVIRQAQEADLPAAAAMYDRLDAETYRRMEYRFPPVAAVGQIWVASFSRTLGRYSALWLAEAGSAPEAGTPVGFCLGRIKRAAPYLGGVLVGEVSEVWVAPEGRGLGLGRKLVRQAIDWLWEQEVHSIEVQVHESNAPSQALFSSLGFQPELRQYRLMK